MSYSEKILKSVLENSDKNTLWNNYIDALHHNKLNFSIKKIGQTDISYIQVGMQDVYNSGMANSTNLGTSHSERTYFLWKDNELCVITTETGGGYLNRGQSVYHINIKLLFSTSDFTVSHIKKKTNYQNEETKNLEIGSMSELHEKIKNIYGINVATKGSIYDLTKKELTSFLRSMFTTNRFSTPIVYSKYSYLNSEISFNDNDFFKKFHDKYFKTLTKKEYSKIELCDFLNDTFENELLISYTTKEKQYYYDQNGKELKYINLIENKNNIEIKTIEVLDTITKIELFGELKENLWKTNLTMTQDFLYNHPEKIKDLKDLIGNREEFLENSITFYLRIPYEIKKILENANKINNISNIETYSEETKELLNKVFDLEKTKAINIIDEEIKPVKDSLFKFFENLGYGISFDINYQMDIGTITFIATP